jgi:uncharacterized membrane protein
MLVYFHTKNPHLSIFGWASDWKMLVGYMYVIIIWNILRPLGKFITFVDSTLANFCGHLVHFSPFWHVLRIKVYLRRIYPAKIQRRHIFFTYF